MDSEAERVKRLVANLEAVFNRRLGNLAQEMALAGMQILMNDFGFTQEQATQWLDKTIARANVNRSSKE